MSETSNSAPILQPIPAPAPAKGKDKPKDAPVEIDDGKKIYTVTDLAGPRVAGQLVGEERTIRLTDAEALSELLDGTVVAKGEDLHPMFQPAAKPA